MSIVDNLSHNELFERVTRALVENFDDFGAPLGEITVMSLRDVAAEACKRADQTRRAAHLPGVISDAVPLKASRRVAWSKTMRLIAALLPGQSVLIEFDHRAGGQHLQHVCRANYRCADSFGWKLTARQEPNGTRVWRIS